MANGQENLIPLNKRSKEVQRRIQEKGRQANKAKWAEKKSLQDKAKAIMEQAADPHVAAAMRKTGIDINDNSDVVLAGIYKGVIKGDIKAIDKWLELTDENIKENERKEIRALERRKAELETEKAEMENELYKMRLDAIKGIGQDELPDDGFLEALKGAAAEDWTDDIL